MSILLGHALLDSFHGTLGTFSQDDLNHLKPYTHITGLSIDLYKQPNPASPVLPPENVTFDGNFYYKGIAIIASGKKVVDENALIVWTELSAWQTAVAGLGKQFILSIGGEYDIISTPELDTDLPMIDMFLNNIRVLKEELVSLQGLDFDWRYMSLTSNTSDTTFNRTLFLGYLIGSIRELFPQWIIIYTVKPNAFFPFIHAAQPTNWESDREGMGVLFGLYLRLKSPEMRWSNSKEMQANLLKSLPLGFKLDSILRSSDACPDFMIRFIGFQMPFIHIAAYDGPVGNIALTGCYTLDDYKTVLIQTISIMKNASVLLLGYEPMIQKTACHNPGLCGSSCLLTDRTIDTLDWSLVLTKMLPIFDFIQNQKIGGISILGVNVYKDISGNICEGNLPTCMADYALALAHAYAVYAGLPTECKWDQTTDPVTGICSALKCPIPPSDIRESYQLSELNGANPTHSSDYIIVSIVSGSIGFILVIVSLIYKDIPRWLLVVGVGLLIFSLVMSYMKRAARYKCDAKRGCIEDSNGTSLSECQTTCVPQLSFSYNPSSNQCSYTPTYGEKGSISAGSSKEECEHQFASYTCNGTTCNLSTDSGSIDYITCSKRCGIPLYTCSDGPVKCIQSNQGTLTEDECKQANVTYSLDQTATTCIPSCALVGMPVMTKEECEATISYKCDNGECVPSASGTMHGRSNCICPCPTGTTKIRNPFTNRNSCIQCTS